MGLAIFSKIVRITLLSLFVSLLPLTCMGYVQGDINSDNKIGLQESIYALQVAAGAAIPLSGTTINVPADIPTIQQAIDAASNGDTISIAAGTYTGALTINGKTLVLSGAGTASTFIDGGTANAISMDHSPGVLIENLTVQKGVKGIYAINNSHVEINQVTVKDCTDRGIQIDTNSNAKLGDSAIENTGNDGIGVIRNSGITITGIVTTKDNSRHGLMLFLGSTALISESTFTDTGNDARGISATQNSSIYVNNSSLSVLANKTTGLHVSTASNIELYGDSTQLTVEDCGEAGIKLIASSRLYSESPISIRRSMDTQQFLF